MDPLEIYGVRIPPMAANIHQACYQCFKLQAPDSALQKCSACKRVSYCSTACQKANWSRHKGICKAFKAIELRFAPEIATLTRLDTKEDGTPLDSDPVKLTQCLNQIAVMMMSGLEDILGRKIDIPERNLVGWEPRCLACGRSDTVLRMEAALKGLATPEASLKPCPNCKLSFYCSEVHWALVNDKHSNAPWSGEDGPSQCDANRGCQQDIRFELIMSGANQGEFMWAPERTAAQWKSLKDIAWTEFRPYLVEADLPIPPEALDQMLHSATEGLSMPMTILWALENLYNNETWTKKETLVIDILGAASKELQFSKIFEEILHRLPDVKKLILNFISPELATLTEPKSFSINMDTCPECTQRRRRRTQAHYPQEYHTFIQEKSGHKPDLAVAFNSGASQENGASWLQTMEILVERGTPTLFTAYNQTEAAEEAEMLRSVGAHLHPQLGPGKNQWGSEILRTEPNTVTGFYAVNGWLAGGFPAGTE
ncbi:hypothetical protein CPB83DRAFT_853653 [Crepidotus variabilis]|uniref:MYND-type domain-containing protein n=1 Tax=Crepidotus variabilis TaxID=179855 RepID=A0A9P6EHC4_9AGAR|nr:hypothetical protein CPB83DRAFT_853653 [Crepidotus variabilis]